jgi:hypothetical protein
MSAESGQGWTWNCSENCLQLKESFNTETKGQRPSFALTSRVTKNNSTPTSHHGGNYDAVNVQHNQSQDAIHCINRMHDPTS